MTGHGASQVPSPHAGTSTRPKVWLISQSKSRRYQAPTRALPLSSLVAGTSTSILINPPRRRPGRRYQAPTRALPLYDAAGVVAEAFRRRYQAPTQALPQRVRWGLSMRVARRRYQAPTQALPRGERGFLHQDETVAGTKPPRRHFHSNGSERLVLILRASQVPSPHAGTSTAATESGFLTSTYMAGCERFPAAQIASYVSPSFYMRHLAAPRRRSRVCFHLVLPPEPDPAGEQYTG